MPSAWTPSTSHSAGLAASAWAMPSRSLTTPVSLLAAIVQTRPARGARSRSQSRSWRPSRPTGTACTCRSSSSKAFQWRSDSGTALCSVAPYSSRSGIVSPRSRRSRSATRADSTAVWMPSVAPLTNSRRPVGAPSTRRARARTSSISERARSPVLWVLLGLP